MQISFLLCVFMLILESSGIPDGTKHCLPIDQLSIKFQSDQWFDVANTYYLISAISHTCGFKFLSISAFDRWLRLDQCVLLD